MLAEKNTTRDNLRCGRDETETNGQAIAGASYFAATTGPARMEKAALDWSKGGVGRAATGSEKKRRKKTDGNSKTRASANTRLRTC